MTTLEVLTTIEITVGDTGFTISGQLNGGGLSTLAGATVTFSLLGVDDEVRLSGRDIVTNAAATITDATNRKVAYKLQAADVAKAAVGAVRWTVALPAGGGNLHFPGKRAAYTIVRING
jgi:hypothetical protein